MTHIRFEHTDEGVVVARAHSQCAWESLALVASALCKTAHAYVHGQGHPVDDYAYWVVLAPGAAATMANPERYFLDDDDACTAERAALLAHRVQTATRGVRSEVSDDELDHPFAFVATPGVPGGEARTLCTLSVLALQAAGELAGPVPAGAMQLACATLPSDDAPGGACAGLIATRLDRPDALELETRHVLCAVADALIDDHPGLAEWIPRHRDPTVRLRTPIGAPGLPLVFVPFIAATEAARRAIDEGDLVDRALARCAHLAFAPVPAQAH